MEVTLALRFGWTPEQIARLDPDYLDELIACLNAKAERDAYIAERER